MPFVKRQKAAHQFFLVASQIGRHLRLDMQELSLAKRRHRRFYRSRQIIGSIQALHFYHLHPADLPVRVVR